MTMLFRYKEFQAGCYSFMSDLKRTFRKLPNQCLGLGSQNLRLEENLKINLTHGVAKSQCEFVKQPPLLLSQWLSKISS